MKQTVVPLELDIAKFGNAAPADANRFDIAAVTVDGNGVPFDRVKDFFAPAQFLELDDDEKLSAPSFEPMVAGIDIGGQGPRFPAGDVDVLEDDALLFETILIDGEAPPAAPPAPVTDEFVTRYLPLGAVATSTLRNTAAARYRGRARQERACRWALVDGLTRRRHGAGDPGRRRRERDDVRRHVPGTHNAPPHRRAAGPVADARPGGGD